MIFHRLTHSKDRIPLYALCLGLFLVLFSGALVVGCQPTAEVVSPPATTAAESGDTTTEPAANPTAPTIDDSTATPAAEEASMEGNPFQLTILHTNDTFGEVDPCG
ncbi:MAG: hypothetical protein ACLFV5_07375 [Anaerolineales bacterium]